MLLNVQFAFIGNSVSVKSFAFIPMMFMR